MPSRRCSHPTPLCPRRADWRGRVAIVDRVEDLVRAHGPTSLEDDLGTAYAIEPPGLWAWRESLYLDQRPEVLPAASAFTPAVPREATRLFVGCSAGRLELDLRERA